MKLEKEVITWSATTPPHRGEKGEKTMVEAMILFGTLGVICILGGLFKVYDWQQERKARHWEQVKRMREYRRKAPRAREKEHFWAA